MRIIYVVLVAVASAVLGAAVSWYIHRHIIASLRSKVRALKAGRPEPAPRRIARAKKQTETSKKLVLVTGIIFGMSVVAGTMMTMTGADITFFVAEIAIAGGVFGSAIVSYENKAKMENVVKIKMGIIKFRLAIGNYLTPEQMVLVESDIQALEASIDGKIDDTVAQAVNQDPDIPRY